MSANMLPPWGAARVRFERDVTRVHALGARAVAHLLLDVAQDGGGPDAAARITAAYASRLTPEMVQVAGGDRFPASPIRAVPTDLSGRAA